MVQIMAINCIGKKKKLDVNSQFMELYVFILYVNILFRNYMYLGLFILNAERHMSDILRQSFILILFTRSLEQFLPIYQYNHILETVFLYW